MDSEDTLKFSVLSGVRPTIETMPLERHGAALRCELSRFQRTIGPMKNIVRKLVRSQS